MLLQGQTSGGREQVFKKLDLGDSKLKFREANCEAVLLAKEKDFLEVVPMGGEIFAKDEIVIIVDKTEGKHTQDKIHHG